MAIGNRRSASSSGKASFDRHDGGSDSGASDDEGRLHEASAPMRRARSRRRLLVATFAASVAALVIIAASRRMLFARTATVDATDDGTERTRVPKQPASEKPLVPTPSPTSGDVRVRLDPSSIEFPGFVTRRGLLRGRCAALMNTSAVLNYALGEDRYIEGWGDHHLATAVAAVREAGLRRRLRRSSNPSSFERKHRPAAPPSDVGSEAAAPSEGFIDIGMTSTGPRRRGGKRPPTTATVWYEESPLVVEVYGQPEQGATREAIDASGVRWLLSLLTTLPTELAWFDAASPPLRDLASGPGTLWSERTAPDTRHDDDDAALVTGNGVLSVPAAALALLRRCAGHEATTEPWQFDANANTLLRAKPLLETVTLDTGLPTHPRTQQRGDLDDPAIFNRTDAVLPDDRPDVVLIPCAAGGRHAAERLHIAAQRFAEIIFIGCLTDDVSVALPAVTVENSHPLLRRWATLTEDTGMGRAHGEQPAAAAGSKGTKEKKSAFPVVEGSSRHVVELFLKRFPSIYQVLWRCGTRAVESFDSEGRHRNRRYDGGDANPEGRSGGRGASTAALVASTCIILSRRPPHGNAAADRGRLSALWASQLGGRVRADDASPWPGSFAFCERAIGTVFIEQHVAAQRVKQKRGMPPPSPPPLAQSSGEPEAPNPAAGYWEGFQQSLQVFEASASAPTARQLCDAVLARSLLSAGIAASRKAASEVCENAAARVPWRARREGVLAQLTRTLVDLVAGGEVRPLQHLYTVLPPPNAAAEFTLGVSVTNADSAAPFAMSTFASDALPLLVEAASAASSLLVVGCDFVTAAIALHVHQDGRGPPIAFYGAEQCPDDYRDSLHTMLEADVASDRPGLKHRQFACGDRTPRYALALTTVQHVTASPFVDVVIAVPTPQRPYSSRRYSANFAADRLLVVNLLASQPVLPCRNCTLDDASLTGGVDLDHYVPDAVGEPPSAGHDGEGTERYPMLVVGGGVLSLARARNAPAWPSVEDMQERERRGLMRRPEAPVHPVYRQPGW